MDIGDVHNLRTFFVGIVRTYVRVSIVWSLVTISVKWAAADKPINQSNLNACPTHVTSTQRTRWVLENHGRTQIAVQTLRDMLSVTTAIATAAMSFISIFIGLSKSSSASLLTCDPQDGADPCNTFDERLKFVR